MVHRKERNAEETALRPSNATVFTNRATEFMEAAGRIDLGPNVVARLKVPDRSIIISIPLRMDTGEVHIFTCYRV